MSEHTLLEDVERWGKFEFHMNGSTEGNPFKDVILTAVFTFHHRHIEVDGFYNGNGHYVVRFMPDQIGSWSFETKCNSTELNGIQGEFTCIQPTKENHGPVKVANHYHFEYSDGTPYYAMGTTCYAWTHQGKELEEQTLETLKDLPFNKMRMFMFPKSYQYNTRDPEFYPYEGKPDKDWDFTRFSPDFWQHLEQRIEDLQRLGIEADLILIHTYCRWGFNKLSVKEYEFLLRYALARLSSYRNIWWSMSNEYDLCKNLKMSDWDRFFQLVIEHDPYVHLRSIHNWHCPTHHYDSNAHWYDHTKPWVTHLSIQHHDMHYVTEWRDMYKKPIVVDECRYEGNIDQAWGSMSAEKMLECFWEGMVRGGYVTHGETYMHPEDLIWWSHGGKIYGHSTEKIKFLRQIIEEGPQLNTTKPDFDWDACAGGIDGEYYLVYFGDSRPSYRMLDLPQGVLFTIELIDTWEMTIKQLEGTYEGQCRVDLPSKAYQAIRIKRKG